MESHSQPKDQLKDLQKSIKQIPIEYEEKCSARLFNPSVNHRKCILFLKFLLNTAADNIFFRLSKTTKITEDEFKLYQYTVFYGALLHIMLQIENEYHGSSPNNSELYVLCKNALGIKHSKDVPAFIKLNLFSDLRHFMRDLINDANALEFLNNLTVNKGFFSPTLFTDAKDFFKTRAESIETLMQSESFLWTCTKSAVNYILMTAAGIACFELAVAGYGLGIGHGMLSILGEKLGSLLIRGPWGAYIGAAIGAKYEKDTVVGALTSSFMFTFKYLRDWAFGETKSSLDMCEDSAEFRKKLKEQISARQQELCEAQANKVIDEVEFYRTITALPLTEVLPGGKEPTQLPTTEALPDMTATSAVAKPKTVQTEVEQKTTFSLRR